MTGALLVNLILAAVVGYAAIVGLAYVSQERLVYFPQVGREFAATPQAYGLTHQTLRIATEDHEQLQAWWVPVAQPRGAVLLFHGNAGNISMRIDYLVMFSRMGYSTLIIDYRGYGTSTGTPSEAGTYRDAEAAWRWLRETQGIAPHDIVVFGESLGGAVASWLAARHAPRALILASTFTSVPDLGAEVYPFLPVRLISRILYDNRENLRAVRAPVLIAHSPEDDIIPVAHGRTLFEAANEPKAFLELAGGHNDGFIFMRDAWVQALAAFLERHSPGRE